VLRKAQGESVFTDIVTVTNTSLSTQAPNEPVPLRTTSIGVTNVIEGRLGLRVFLTRDDDRTMTLDERAASEFAEGGQHHHVAAQPEAGHSNAIVRAAADPHRRMQMPGECECAANELRVVAERHRAHAPGLGLDADFEPSRRRASSAIVIAFDQHQVESRMPRAPGTDRFERRARMRLARVEQIAEENDGLRAKTFDQARQPRQRPARRSFRHRNS
jgi:hypothetical protein